MGDFWPRQIEQALQEADYFLLLLSESAGLSEFVTEEVRRARELRQSRPGDRPVILPIRVRNNNARIYPNPTLEDLLVDACTYTSK